MWHRFPVGVRAWLGIELNPVSHAERVVSAIGGFLGIFFILLVRWAVLGDRTAAVLIVASMGASAVLLFGLPHGPLSQPWALIGGHSVSAIVGVSCALLVPNEFVAAALAVGLAIGLMHYLRCLHPPGGATAITAVLGGPTVHALGFWYLLTPVLLNVAIILLTAIGVNWFFAWRRYPAGLARKMKADTETEKKHLAEGSLSHSDIEYAMRQINSTLDVTENDLTRIYQLAAEHSKSAHMEPWQVRQRHFYSNGRYGDDWQIRQVVDESQQVNPDKDLVIYKVLAGKDRRKSGVCTRAEFARWARYEVFQDEATWKPRRV